MQTSVTLSWFWNPIICLSSPDRLSVPLALTLIYSQVCARLLFIIPLTNVFTPPMEEQCEVIPNVEWQFWSKFYRFASAAQTPWQSLWDPDIRQRPRKRCSPDDFLHSRYFLSQCGSFPTCRREAPCPWHESLLVSTLSRSWSQPLDLRSLCSPFDWQIAVLKTSPRQPPHSATFLWRISYKRKRYEYI